MACEHKAVGGGSLCDYAALVLLIMDDSRQFMSQLSCRMPSVVVLGLLKEDFKGAFFSCSGICGSNGKPPSPVRNSLFTGNELLIGKGGDTVTATYA